MAKVRVPEELRPPERFAAFSCQFNRGLFRVKGAFRVPQTGEFYWSALPGCIPKVLRSSCEFETSFESRVILEKVVPHD